METAHVTRRFEAIGARVKFASVRGNDIAIDVKKDKAGSYFEIALPEQPLGAIELQVLDAKPNDRHLLLLSKETRVPNTERGVFKHRYLCGHDERSWFVAGIRGDSVSSVSQAKADLKPQIIHSAEQRLGVKPKMRNRRHNAGSIRQGEWFFTPADNINPDDAHVLRNEPLQRGRNKPHMAEFLYRIGGTSVHVCYKYPLGITDAEYKRLLITDKDATKYNWRTMRRDAVAYVKGKIRHPDHKTLNLRTWHLVTPNTEIGRNVVFLD